MLFTTRSRRCGITHYQWMMGMIQACKGRVVLCARLEGNYILIPNERDIIWLGWYLAES